MADKRVPAGTTLVEPDAPTPRLLFHIWHNLTVKSCVACPGALYTSLPAASHDLGLR